VASLLVAGIAIIAGAAMDDPLLSALLIAIAGAADSFLLGAAWGVCLDISGPHAGLVTGAMNTAGQLGAVLSPIVLAHMLEDQSRHQDWFAPLLIIGILYLAGAVCWLFVDPRQPIVGLPPDGR
jgi:MFS family permease